MARVGSPQAYDSNSSVGEDTEHPESGPFASYYLVIGLAVISATLILFTLDRLKYRVHDFLESRGTLTDLPAMALTWMTLTDYMLVAIALLLFSTAALTEVRRGGISNALTSLQNPHGRVMVVVLIAWFSHCFLHPGYLVTGDTNFHVARMNHFFLGLQEGFYPIWDNYFNLGVPLLQFTGPLVHWSGGLLTFFTGDVYTSTKLVLFLSHVGAGIATYLLLARMGIRPFACLIAGLGYSGSFAQLHLFMYGGDIPQTFTLLLLPVGFLALEIVAKRGLFDLRWSALALISGLTIINHPSNGLFIGVYMSLLLFLSLPMRRYPLNHVPAVVSAAILGLFTTTFIVVPVLSEQDWVTMTGTSQLLYFQWPDFAYFKDLLIWRNSNPEPSNFDSYLGLSICVLGLIGAYSAIRGSQDLNVDRNFFLISIIGLLLSFVLRGPHLRSIIFVLFFVAVLAGLGTHYLLYAFKGRRHLPAILLAVVVLDIGSTSIQPWARTDKDYFATAAAQLATAEPPQRTVKARTLNETFQVTIWDASPLPVFPIQTLSIPFGYSATHFHNYGAVILKDVEKDLVTGGTLSTRSESLLAMLNVGRIVHDKGDQLGLPPWVEANDYNPALGRFITIANATPYLASTRLISRGPPAPIDRPVFWDEWFYYDHPSWIEAKGFVEDISEAMQVTPETRSAQAIPVRNLPLRDARRSAESRDALLETRLLSYSVDLSTVQLAVESSHAGYIQLSHAWYPEQQVLHNEIPITPLRGSLNLIVVPMSVGVNHYDIRPTLSLTRRWTVAVTMLSLVLIALIGTIGSYRRHLLPSRDKAT